MKKLTFTLLGLVTIVLIGASCGTEPIVQEELELESQPGEIVQEDTFQVKQELEQAQLEIEKIDQEAKELEIKQLKAKEEAQKLAEQQKQEELRKQEEAQRLAETQRLAEEQARLEEQQRHKEQQLVRAKEELNKIERDIKNWFKVDTCRNDFQNYESTREMLNLRLSELTNRVNQQIETICNKTEQLENQLIQEVKNLKQVEDLDLLLEGENKLLNQFDRAINEMKQVINDEVRKTAEVFNRLSKQLEEDVKRAKEEVERKGKIVQAINQLNPMLIDISNQLANLYTQIENKKTEIENTKNRGGMTTSFLEAKLAQLIPEHNTLVAEYNSLLNTEQRIRTILYELDDYYEYEIPIPAESRAFLSSLEIYL